MGEALVGGGSGQSKVATTWKGSDAGQGGERGEGNQRGGFTRRTGLLVNTPPTSSELAAFSSHTFVTCAALDPSTPEVSGATLRLVSRSAEKVNA